MSHFILENNIHLFLTSRILLKIVLFTEMSNAFLWEFLESFSEKRIKHNQEVRT